MTMHLCIGSQMLLNETVDVSNLHNKKNIETVLAPLKITNIDVSINCVLQGI